MTHSEMADRIIELCEINGYGIDIHFDMRPNAIKIKPLRDRGKSFSRFEDALQYLEVCG
jgi:hypothetical protein